MFALRLRTLVPNFKSTASELGRLWRKVEERARDRARGRERKWGYVVIGRNR